MTEKPMTPGVKTRHVALTVTAHMVDVYDSDTTPAPPEDEPVMKPGTTDQPLVLVWAQTRHCPLCVGLALREFDEPSGEHARLLEDCLAHVPGVIKEMLTDASNAILGQANGWVASVLRQHARR
jgi:hypothetical protein